MPKLSERMRIEDDDGYGQLVRKIVAWADEAATLEAQLGRAMIAMGLTWGDLEGFGSAVEGICETMIADQAKLSKMEEALNLMLASPKDRLEYCKANDLLPSIITATESVDPYWREAIANEALAGGVDE